MAEERREHRTRWVKRGRYAVELEVEVVYPQDDPTQACLEPSTLRMIDEVARQAEAGNVAYLKSVGKVYELLPT